MHTFLLFFAWPTGGAWSNVVAMPACGFVAAVFAVCFRAPLASWWHRHFGHKAELDVIRKQLDAHADLLNPHTPGGLNAVMDEVRRAVTAAESAHEDIKALGVIAGKAKTPRRGATELRKTGSGKAEEA